MVVQHILENKAVLDKQQQEKFFDLIENSMKKGIQAGCLAPKKN